MSGSPSMPPLPEPPAPPKEAPKRADTAVKNARIKEKQAARYAAGRSGQIKTKSDLEKTDPNKAARTLLG